MTDNEQVKQPETNNGTIPYIPVDALMDVVVVNDIQGIICKEEIRGWSGIVEIVGCELKVTGKKICVSPGGNCWIIEVMFDLKIDYLTKNGYMHSLIRSFVCKKEIPFPAMTSEKYHNCSDLYPQLFILRAECVNVEIKCIEGSTVLIATVEMDIQIVAVVQEVLPVLVAVYDNKTKVNKITAANAKTQKTATDKK